MLKKLAGYRIGQIQVVFSLSVDEAQVPSERLAYVEWFSKFTLPESNHGMHKLKRSVENGRHIVRKLDLLHLCFSLNFYFLCLFRNFLLCFLY